MCICICSCGVLSYVCCSYTERVTEVSKVDVQKGRDVVRGIRKDGEAVLYVIRYKELPAAWRLLCMR